MKLNTQPQSRLETILHTMRHQNEWLKAFGKSAYQIPAGSYDAPRLAILDGKLICASNDSAWHRPCVYSIVGPDGVYIGETHGGFAKRAGISHTKGTISHEWFQRLSYNADWSPSVVIHPLHGAWNRLRDSRPHHRIGKLKSLTYSHQNELVRLTPDAVNFHSERSERERWKYRQQKILEAVNRHPGRPKSRILSEARTSDADGILGCMEDAGLIRLFKMKLPDKGWAVLVYPN
jgi:hypothetical protein